MFRRSNILTDTNLSITMLKDRVCQAVETEIQNEINDFDITDEECIDISSKFWERFYSCCEQYHVKSCQPLGLVNFSSVGAICIVKKSAFSLLRPCDSLEHLMLAGGNAEIDNVLSTSLATNLQSSEDLIKLVSILAMLEHCVPDEIKRDIQNKLYQLQMPDEIVAELVTDLLSRSYDDSVCIFDNSKLLKRK